MMFLTHKQRQLCEKGNAVIISPKSSIVQLQANFDISKVWGLFLQVRNTRSAN